MTNKEEELFNWDVREEKIRWNKQLEFSVIIAGVTLSVIAIIFNSYLVTVVIGFSLFIFITLGRKKARLISFLITTEGFLLDQKFYPIKKIKEFNIIDDPKEKGRLVLRLDDLFEKITIPIYDDDFDLIEEAFGKIKINKNEDLTPSFLDIFTKFF